MDIHLQYENVINGNMSMYADSRTIMYMFLI